MATAVCNAVEADVCGIEIADEIACGHGAMRRLTLIALLGTAAGFCVPHVLHSRLSPRCRLSCCTDGGDGDKPPDKKPDERSLVDRINAMLDTPVFDADASDDADEPKIFKDFKSLIQEDYQFAETLYVGGVFALLLFFAQQGVRIYKHCYFMPDRLCPWDVTPSLDAVWSNLQSL